MKKIFHMICSMAVMAVFPTIAGAVGTYYNGNLYQNPQQRYARGGYYNSYGNGAGRSNYEQQNIQNTLGTQKNKKKVATKTRQKQGFVLDAGLTHEMANWEFEMNTAGSKLHYDNVAWNVLDVNGVYYSTGDTKFQINAGFRYGKQFGKSNMVDDDISSGAQLWAYEEEVYEGKGIETIITGLPAMSAGTSKDGTQMGFNVGLGLTDAFSIGRMKVTPSVGFRYLKYKLTTTDNKGMMIQILDTPDSGTAANCIYGDEIQCVPYLGFVGDVNQLVYDTSTGVYDYVYAGYGGLAELWYDANGTLLDATKENENKVAFITYLVQNPGGFIDTGGTYYYEQSGVSHEYETTWMGPYLALDMDYQLNDNNSIIAGIEFGLPLYTSEGVQPYRIDWQQSPSVKDEGSFGDAYHIGLKMNWLTAITNTVNLNLGFTYDYYSVSDAAANTYWVVDGVQKDDKEIDSVYKSMGLHAGINVRF